MKVLETPFAGYAFRSRCEARWAVFLKFLEVPFDYEPEGFDLGGLLYLPDFWLPNQQCFMEVKGESPDDEAIAKARRLSELTSHPVFIFVGNPAEPCPKNGSGYSESAYFYSFTGGEDNGYWWCECPHCHLLGIEFNGRADRLTCKCPRSAHGGKGYNHASPRLLHAYSAAKSERFGT